MMHTSFFWPGWSTGLVLLAASCRGPAPANNAPAKVPVDVYTVKQENASYVDLYPGTVVALNEVDIRTEINGYVTGILFKEGTHVHKGQKLYEIEHSKYAAAYAQARANVQIAKANLGKAQQDAERYTRLHQQDAIARQTYDYALSTLESARSQVTAAEAQLTSAATDLRHAMITAPFDGTIGISLVRLGTFVTAGQTQLNTISSTDPMAVDFEVSEKEIGRFLDLQRQPTRPNDSTFTLQLPDNSVYARTGRLTLLDRAVDPQTGTIKVRLTFPNPDQQLRAGMSCNVRVLNQTGKPQLLAPYKAVTEQMGEYFVFVVQDDTARQHKVTLGARIKDKVIVREGLAAGDPIVVEGIQRLKDNTPVQTGAPAATAQPGSTPAGRQSSAAQ